MKVRPDLLIVYFVCLGIALHYIPWYKMIPQPTAIPDPPIKCKVKYGPVTTENFNIYGKEYIYGLISAEDGPLIGANVIIEDTTIGTISDIDGEFSLRTPDYDATLLITYTGYRSCRCKASRNEFASIIMSEGRMLE